MRLKDILRTVTSSETSETELLKAVSSGTQSKPENSGPLVTTTTEGTKTTVDVLFAGGTQTFLGSLRENEKDRPPELKIRRYTLATKSGKPSAIASNIGVDISAQAFDALTVKNARQKHLPINARAAQDAMSNLLDDAENSNIEKGKLMQITAGQKTVVGVARVHKSKRIHDFSLETQEQLDPREKTLSEDQRRQEQLLKVKQIARERHAQKANGNGKRQTQNDDER